MKPCIHCGSTTAQRGSDASVACFNYSECDTRRCAMQEPTKAPCPFVYEDGRKCADKLGHEEYALNCGHLPPAPDTLPEPKVQRPYGRRMPALASVAMAAMLLGGMAPPPPRRELDPLPRPIEDEPPPLPTKMMGSTPYGRMGVQPLPRAFYSSRLMPGEDPFELQGLLNQAEKRASDQRHLTAAEEKRARKARKRLGK